MNFDLVYTDFSVVSVVSPVLPHTHMYTDILPRQVRAVHMTGGAADTKRAQARFSVLTQTHSPHITSPSPTLTAPSAPPVQGPSLCTLVIKDLLVCIILAQVNSRCHHPLCTKLRALITSRAGSCRTNSLPLTLWAAGDWR